MYGEQVRDVYARCELWFARCVWCGSADYAALERGVEPEGEVQRFFGRGSGLEPNAGGVARRVRSYF